MGCLAVTKTPLPPSCSANMTVQPVASIDTETRSHCDLKKAGLHRYFEDASTELLCLAYQIGDGPVVCWRPGVNDPAPLLAHIESGKMVVIHNAAFDREGFNALSPPHWPRPTLSHYERGDRLLTPSNSNGFMPR